MSDEQLFMAFLERRGFQADACKSCVDHDFYRLAWEMWRALEEISNSEDGWKWRQSAAEKVLYYA